MKNMHWKEYDIPAVIRRRADRAKALLAQDKQRAKILDPQWHYVPASETDVLATFKRVTGWVPPSRNK